MMKKIDKKRKDKTIFLWRVLCFSILFSITVLSGNSSVSLARISNRDRFVFAYKKVSSLQIQDIAKTYVIKPDSQEKLKVRIKYSGKGAEPDVKLVWHSSDPTVVSISDDGVVSALKEGKSIVYASYDNKRTNKVEIIVGKPVSKISLAGEEVILMGASTSLEAFITPADCAVSQLHFTSSNKRVASVDRSGKVQGKASGTAVISAVSMDGHGVKASLIIRVRKFKKSEGQFIAHRGLSSKAPENTKVAFRLAGQAGFWGVECDIWETAPQNPKDSSSARFAISHDRYTGRIYGKNLDIRKTKPKKLAKLIARKGNGVSRYSHEKMPFLEDYLVICNKYSMHPVIDIKSSYLTKKSIQRLVKTVQKYIPLEEVLFSSFHRKNLDRVNAAVSELGKKTSTLFLYHRHFAKKESVKNVRDAVRKACTSGYTAVGVPYKLMNVSLAKYMASKNVDSIVWVADRYTRVVPIVTDCHVKAVITNRRLFQ